MASQHHGIYSKLRRTHGLYNDPVYDNTLGPILGNKTLDPEYVESTALSLGKRTLDNFPWQLSMRNTGTGMVTTILTYLLTSAEPGSSDTMQQISATWAGTAEQ